MTVRHWFSLLLVVLFLAGLTPSIEAGNPSVGPEAGDLFKGQSIDMYFYENQFFSFSLTIPGDWHPLSSKELLQLMRKESPGGGLSDQTLKETRQFYLLSISRYRPTQRGPGGEFNPNIVLVASDLLNLPGIKTARDHIELMKPMMKALGVQPTSDAYPMQLGGIEFWRLDGVERGEEKTYITYISAVRKGYTLMFQLQAGRKTDTDKLVQVLKTLHFE